MGNPYNSIYDDIDDWSGSVTYLKNYIGCSSIPIREALARLKTEVDL